jgi:iron complex transport system permease protein
VQVAADKTGVEAYGALTGRRAARILVLAALLAASAVVSLAVGSSSAGLRDTLRTGLDGVIFWELRVPRVLMGLLVGSGLAVGGAVTQAVLRNPLASPFTLGVASGAGFGAALGIVLAGAIAKWAVAGGAFGFALVTALFILGVARMKSATPETLVLAGVAIMFLFSAGTSLLQFLGTEQQIQAIVFWSFGNLSRASWTDILIAAGMILPALPLLFLRGWDLNLLLAGDEMAASLGVNVDRLRLAALLLAALMTAGAICFTGVIGFIGLVGPHLARMMVGGDHRFLLPASALSGALLVLVSDCLGRTLFAPHMIPIGIVTAFLGVPFFFALLIRRKREFW